jgi:DNA invertase Pin-like site-specific DNA recombinase
LCQDDAYIVADPSFVKFEFNLLFRFPIIEIMDGHFVAVDPQLVIERVTFGLFYDLFERRKMDFTKRFGYAFDRFIGQLLGSVCPAQSLWSASDWEQQNEGTKRKDHGRVDIINWYKDEGKSGSKDTDKRTDFTRLLAEAPKAQWEVVLCLDISRFGRLDSIEGAFAKKTLRDAGKKLHAIIEGEIDWNSTTGRIVDTVLSEAQHDYSVRLGQKTLTGKLDAFRRGDLFGFKCPYGMARKVWDNRGTERVIPRTEKFTKPKGWRATLVPGDPDEVEIVRWLFESFSSRDVGYRWLAAELNRQRKPSPTGHKWCAKVVEDILENEKYAGNMRLNKPSTAA